MAKAGEPGLEPAWSGTATLILGFLTGVLSGRPDKGRSDHSPGPGQAGPGEASRRGKPLTFLSSGLPPAARPARPHSAPSGPASATVTAPWEAGQASWSAARRPASAPPPNAEAVFSCRRGGGAEGPRSAPRPVGSAAGGGTYSHVDENAPRLRSAPAHCHCTVNKPWPSRCC